jgi:cysteine-rich repeat protein
MTHEQRTGSRIWWLLAAALLIVSTLAASSHAQTRKSCLRDCKEQKKACIATFKNRSKIERGLCANLARSDRKSCKKAAKDALKTARGDCTGAFKAECKPCCKESAANCSVTVCGDGVQTAPEECDVGDRMDGDGCSSDCLMEGLPPGPLGTRVFSLASESRARSRFVSEVGTPAGTIILDALEPDERGVAEVRSVGGPFFVTTDVNLGAFGLNVRICSRIESCTGTIYCSGGSNVDVIVELNSLRANETCAQVDRCAGQSCCENSCEGFIDPAATVVEAVGSGNSIVNTRVADRMPTTDSGPGAMILTCQQTNRAFDLTTGLGCDVQDYGSNVQGVVYTTGTSTATVLNHCLAPSDKVGNTDPTVVLDLTAVGENFSCVGWSTENGRGVLANTIPQEEPTDALFGDTTFATVLHD